MHTARIPPVDPAEATITAVVAMHAGHIGPSSEFLNRARLSALPVLSLPFSPSPDVGFSLRTLTECQGGQVPILRQVSRSRGVTSVAGIHRHLSLPLIDGAEGPLYAGTIRSDTYAKAVQNN